MNELLVVITLWLSANFGLPYVAEPPEIVAVSPASLSETRHRLAREAGAAEFAASAPTVHAFYHVDSHTIFIAKDWRADSAADISILVHELVHHLQAEAAVPYHCAAAREKVAYEAQDRWLKQFGTSLAAEFGIDSATRLARSACFH